MLKRCRRQFGNLWARYERAGYFPHEYTFRQSVTAQSPGDKYGEKSFSFHLNYLPGKSRSGPTSAPVPSCAKGTSPAHASSGNHYFPDDRPRLCFLTKPAPLLAANAGSEHIPVPSLGTGPEQQQEPRPTGSDTFARAQISLLLSASCVIDWQAAKQWCSRSFSQYQENKHNAPASNHHLRHRHPHTHFSPLRNKVVVFQTDE